MQIYYIDPFEMPLPCLVQLGKEESGHCIRVLRMHAGDGLNLTDGNGHLYRGVIMSENAEKCPVRIDSVTVPEAKRKYSLHLAVAPTKNPARFEWLLEKATEIGIEQITPLICQRSERQHIRTDRLMKIIRSASMQSVNLYIPTLNEPALFGEFINTSRTTDNFVAYVEEKQNLQLRNLYKPGHDCTILIGPEGDFTKDEINQAIRQLYVPVSLGSSRLRTETAALVAVHTIALLND